MADPPIVIALHGITSNGRSWDAVARELGDEARLIAPDQRGRGDAAGRGGPYGIAQHVADAVAVLDDAGAERAVVAGHSMGAYVAARLAAEHPDRVRGLVLVDGALALPVPDGVDPDELLDLTLGPALARLSQTFADHAAYHAFWRAHPAFAGDEIADVDLAAFADHELVGQPPELRPGIAEEAVRADGRDLILDEPTRTALDGVSAPGMLLRAQRGLMDDDNPFIPPDQAAAFSHPTVELAEVEDTNHYTILLGARGSRATADAIRARLA